MRIAVFTNQFPSKVSTFFAWDMAALGAAGADIEVFAVWPDDPELWDWVPQVAGADAVPRDRIHHLTVRSALPSAVRHPSPGRLGRRSADAGRALAASLRWGPTTVAKTGYVLPLAWHWAQRATGRYDHVLAYWGNHAATCAWAFARELPGGPVPFSTYLHAGIDLYFQRALLPTKLRAAAAVLPVCEFNERYLAAHCGRAYAEVRERVHVHHLGIDLDAYPCRRDGRKADTVLGVGRFDRHKGFHHLVDAVGAVPGARLELIGDGDERSALERRAAEVGAGDRVSFLGWRSPDEVRAAMATATVLAHPSTGLGDAVPTVIKEALASGLPVVGSDAVGIPELLDHGRAGRLVPPGDVPSLARELGSLLADGPARDHLARAGRHHAEVTFDARLNGARLARILEQATSDHHARSRPRTRSGSSPGARG